MADKWKADFLKLLEVPQIGAFESGIIFHIGYDDQPGCYSYWKPIHIFYYNNGSIHQYISYPFKRISMTFGQPDIPSTIAYYPNGRVKHLDYSDEDTLHRPPHSDCNGRGGPAIISFYENGNKSREEYMFYGILHRPPLPAKYAGPAFITYSKKGEISTATYWIMGKKISKNKYYELVN